MQSFGHRWWKRARRWWRKGREGNPAPTRTQITVGKYFQQLFWFKNKTKKLYGRVKKGTLHRAWLKTANILPKTDAQQSWRKKTSFEVQCLVRIFQKDKFSKFGFLVSLVLERFVFIIIFVHFILSYLQQDCICLKTTLLWWIWMLVFMALITEKLK